MDSVINRLRNTVTTVTSTVSQLSVVLPGNPVTREFEVTQHVASGGPGLLWKIYSGFKKSTKQEASIFLFEKKLMDKWSRKDRELMIEILKKGVLQLTKLRHPRVLTVQHPLEESRDSLAFATEPVFGSLANLLGSRDNMPEPPVRKHKLDEIEIKYGLLQISEALTFLHRDARMVHGNLCPESIILNEQGIWKLFGLDFSIVAVGNGSEANWPCTQYESDRNPITQRNLDFAAPEFAEGPSLSPASDMFSLALVMYASYSNGKPLTPYHNNWGTYRNGMSSYKTLREITLHDIPPECRPFVKRLLSYIPENRPDSIEFSKVEVLQDSVIRTLTYMDSLAQIDNLQKSQFYKSLLDILPSIPARIRVYRIVPNLAQEFLNPNMVPFVLPSIFRIAETASNEEFVGQILPYLKDVMKLREPVQILFIFMKNMELLLQKTPADITKSDVLPLIYGALESDSLQVQEQCLSIIPSFVSLIDYPAMKNSLLPRIRKLCVSTPTLSVRVNCLVCTGKIMDHMDKWLVIDFVLPFLLEVPSRESAVIMAILGILKLATNHKKLGVTKEVIATKILPFLFPLTVESSLTLAQFNSVVSYIHELIHQLETQQRSKLEEAGAVAQPQMASPKDQPMGANGTELKDVFGDTISYPNTLSISRNGNSNSNTFNSGMLSPQNGSGASTKAHTPTTPLAPSSTKSSNNEMGVKRSPNPDTKDLTSSLMNYQLNQMKLPNMQTPANNLGGVGGSSRPSNSSDWNSPYSMNSNGSVTSPMQQQLPPSFPSMNSLSMGMGISASSAQFPGGFNRVGMGTAPTIANGLAFTSPPPAAIAGHATPGQLQSIPALIPASQQQRRPVDNSGVKALSQRDIDDFLK